MSRTPSKTKRTRPAPRAGSGLGGGMKVAGVALGALLALAAIFYLSNRGGDYRFQVGEPGPGDQAPPIRLPTGQGETFELADHGGETVLLYFQEGLMCQPCWDQLRDVEARWGEFEALGIDRIATITTDPLDVLGLKVADEGISTPVLADPGRTVSAAYDTLSYGMMGGSHNGHSFLVVGPDGTILWRADYGGVPDYTMYLPVESLLADLREGLGEASS